MNDAENHVDTTGTEPEETGKPEHSAGTGDTEKPGTGGTKQETESKTKEKPSGITPESVSQMIKSAFAEFAKQQKEAQTEAEKLSGMNAQQKAEYERDNYRTQLEDLQKQVAVSKMQGAARTMLAEKNIHVPDSLIAAIVTEDAETTKQNVEGFAQAFTAAVEACVKSRLKSETPRTGSAASKLTKEQIFAIKDNDARIKAINENIDLF